MEGTTTRVQDYIQDESVFFGNPEETKKTKRRNEVRFEIRVENGIDVVIERLTARTSKVLALIPSKGQYYVKAGDAYQKLEEENLRKFLLGADEIRLENTRWLGRLESGKDFACQLVRFIEEYDAVLKTGLFRFNPANRHFVYGGITRECVMRHFILENPAIGAHYAKAVNESLANEATRINSGAAYIEQRRGHTLSCPHPGTFLGADDVLQDISWLGCIADIYGIDSAKRVIDTFQEANLCMEMSATRFLELWGCIDPQIDVLAEKAYEGWNNRDIFTEYCTAYLKETNFKHNRSIFDFGRLLEYMADYPGKGFCSLSSLVDMWTNTLSMQNDVYGEVTDKYPDNLLTVHGVLSLKAGEIVNLRQSERFAETCEKNRFLEWENGEWVVLVPHAPQDMVEEAYSQNNCLRSYISAVAEGKKRIAFLRKAEEPEKSLITVEVYMNGHIGQVKGKNNREASAEERRAVSAWAAEKGLAYIEA